MRRFIPLVLLIGALPVVSKAQWGARFTFINLDRMSNVEFPGKAQLGLGLDFDTGIRTGIGLDVHFDPGIFSSISSGLSLFTTDRPISTSRVQGSTAFYTYETSSYAVELRSLYFFSDNDEAAAYIGPFIGVRSYAMELYYVEQQDDYFGTSYTFPRRLSASRFMVPLGLRIGVRDELDNLFSDFHFCLGYQIGGGGALFDTPYTVFVDPTIGQSREVKMSGFTIGAGWAIGIGTDGKANKKE